MNIQSRLMVCASLALSAPGCVLFTNVTYDGVSVSDGGAMDGAREDGSASETGVPDASIVCPANRLNCDGDPANGCETPQSVSSCGPSCAPCVLPNAIAACTNGACAVATCRAGTDNCNGRAEDGCETDLRADAAHCGGCNRRCADDRPICLDGACVAQCPDGFTLCGGRCVNLNEDPTHCGSCSNACTNTGVGTNTCLAGRCELVCPEGFFNCDGNARNGCESLASLEHCGRCNSPCRSVGGVPQICNRDEDTLAGTCITPTACVGGRVIRGDSCVDPTRSAVSCGTPGAACNAQNRPGSCGTGPACVSQCAQGFADCNGMASDGCESSLRSLDHCGSCNAACTITRGRGQCVPGAESNTFVCRIASCDTGFASCDGMPGNGCETDLRTSKDHCGGCGRACTLVAGTHSTDTRCVAGRCAPVCEAGFADCNGDAADGCETSLRSENNCGACAVKCAELCSSNSAASCDATTLRCRCS